MELVKYLDFKFKYLQFINSSIPSGDSSESFIHEFFDRQTDWTQENLIPPLPIIQSQIEEYIAESRSQSPETQDTPDDLDKDSSQSETNRLKTAPDLKFVQYDSEADLVDRNNLPPGNYYFRNGVLVKGTPENRTSALYSNWHGGNVDPQDLQR